MPRAEAGSTKAIGNKIKSKGLGRLRWYCQACERQMRDENGFKCHVQSEAHVRQMLLIGEDPKKHIKQFSNEFMKNFVDLLKTTHGEKQVNANHFYQQVIADKTHIHMNATEWKSLSQFTAYLGRNGICRVEETEKGLFISWIDNSPETMRRREAVMKKERQDKGDEEREQRLIQEQVERAQRNAREKEKEETAEERLLQREDGEKLKLNFGFSAKPRPDTNPAPPQATVTAVEEYSDVKDSPAPTDTDSSTPAPSQAPAKISMSFGGVQKPKNVFASGPKKNPLAGKKGSVLAQPKKMTEQERIMKAEMEAAERKRSRPDSVFNSKRPKLA
ncbi:putative C2H2 finger domain protein (Kin17) [Penicillium brasilianum]|uniref:Putative C2H2 finger domain protein (Kin17) n=1 Tax=Penicillium brasilianum TaxID=104259 RepID=A0A1S9R9Z2_PENBI|nr:putative C2H2 finger domain protein (Kin17) [Penicillium brasilianum]